MKIVSTLNKHGDIKETTYYNDDLEKHREDGPAVIKYNRNHEVIKSAYYVHNKFYREDGPALFKKRKHQCKLPKRCSYGVGKEIGGCIYVHKDYVKTITANLLNNEYKKSLEILKAHNPDFNYTIVKFDRSEKTISFVQCDNFDTEDCPSIQHIIKIKYCLPHSWRPPASGVIYHHKWLFVGDDYTGFDVNESKKYLERWLAIIEKMADKNISSKIGNKVFWENEIVPSINIMDNFEITFLNGDLNITSNVIKWLDTRNIKLTRYDNFKIPDNYIGEYKTTFLNSGINYE